MNPVKKLRNLIIFIIITIVGVSACSQDKPLSIFQTGLIGTQWTLESLNNEVVQESTNPEASIYFTLAASNNKVTGFAGCNNFFGSYQVNNQQLSFSHIASTRMACHNSQFKEHHLFQAFEKTKSYKIIGKQLSLINKNKRVIATFKSI